MNASTNRCPNCGSNGWIMSNKIGALETWHCDQCHHEEVIHIYDPSNEPPLARALEPVFELIGHWRSKPSKEQAEKLISLIPALRHAQASALIRAAIEGVPVPLGRFTEQEAKEIEPDALSLGISMERTTIPAG